MMLLIFFDWVMNLSIMHGKVSFCMVVMGMRNNWSTMYFTFWASFNISVHYLGRGVCVCVCVCVCGEYWCALIGVDRH